MHEQLHVHSFVVDRILKHDIKRTPREKSFPFQVKYSLDTDLYLNDYT